MTTQAELKAEFQRDKQRFFSLSLSQREQAPSHTLKYLTQHHAHIQAETNTLASSLNTLGVPLNAAPLQNTTHGKYSDLYHYRNKQLQQFHAARREPATPIDNWSNMIYNNLGWTHLYRIGTSFSRLTDVMLLQIIKETDWFNALNQSINSFFDLGIALNILTHPAFTNTLNVLSVAFLALRFSIESKTVLEHTLLPSQQEAEAFTAWERFKNEVYTYRYSLSNDIVWATLNALGNFAPFFNIPIPLANNLMFSCCFFDLAVLTYRFYEARDAYHNQKATYETEMLTNPDDDVVKQLLRTLEKNRAKEAAELNISLFGSLTLTTGFAIFLTTSTPIIAPAGTALCLLATAIYAASGYYGDHQKATHLLAQLKLDGKETAEVAALQLAQQEAWNSGWSSFAEALCMPPLLMGAIALYWPVGVMLLAAYATTKIASVPSPEPSQDGLEHIASPC
ncbi:MAG: hypothetical protein K0U24_05190 [Gammaproteobacteria bacterium]|nr:hypothetical protein [Gammaproteobacteria bacterium]